MGVAGAGRHNDFVRRAFKCIDLREQFFCADNITKCPQRRVARVHLDDIGLLPLGAQPIRNLVQLPVSARLVLSFRISMDRGAEQRIEQDVA